MNFQNVNDFISFRVIPFLTGDNKAPATYITHVSYLNWRQLEISIKKSVPYIKGVCLDIGAGKSPYKKYVLASVDKYIAVDREKTHGHIFGKKKEGFIDADIKMMPFEDASADSVLLTQVLEHVDDPVEALSEITRVLKRDGTLVVSAPFIYHGHCAPYDYFRFSEFGLKELLGRFNYEIIEFHRQGYFGTAVVSIMNGWIWALASRNKTLRNLVLLPFILVMFSLANIAGLLLDYVEVKEFSPNFWVVARKG